MLPRRLALFLAFVLLALAAARMGALVAHQPLAGYANQFDMGRTSACFGLWPDLPEAERYGAHRAAPVARYVSGARHPDECYPSSELLFAGAGIGAWKLAAAAGLADPQAMNLRFVGATKALALLLAGIVFTILWRERPAWVVAHALVFTLVLADPMVTLWFNTLYTEFAALWFGYVALMCLVPLTCAEIDRPAWYAAFGIALAGLGLSRQQHLLLPLCLLLLAAPTLWRLRRRIGAVLLIMVIAVAALQALVFKGPPTIRAANSVDTVLGAVLPASRDQGRAVALLGLPSQCEAMIGANWYVDMGEDIPDRCPAALTLPRSALLPLLAGEPAIALRMVMKAAPLAQSSLLHYVGAVEGGVLAPFAGANGLAGSSAAVLAERLPLSTWLGLLLACAGLFVLAAVGWLLTIARGGAPSPVALLGTALGGVFVYALLTSLFGDGYVELQRHLHLGNVAIYALAVLVVALLPIRIAALMASTQSAAVRPSGITVIELAAVLLFSAIAASHPQWLGAWRANANAIGVIDEPVNNGIEDRVVALRGWAMDPFGPARAYAVVNGKDEVLARPWAHPADPDGAALARAFPTYQDPAHARFEILIDTARYPGSLITVRTYAKSVDGTLTEIDRRLLRRSGQ